jgi:hypothetical protein
MLEYWVKEFLEDGWMLHGATFVDAAGNYCQAMAKEKK